MTTTDAPAPEIARAGLLLLPAACRQCGGEWVSFSASGATHAASPSPAKQRRLTGVKLLCANGHLTEVALRVATPQTLVDRFDVAVDVLRGDYH